MLVMLLMGTALAGTTPAELNEALVATSAARKARKTASPAVTEKDYARVAAGEIVTGLEKVAGSSAKRAWGVAVLDHPLDRVWAGVLEFSTRTDFSKTSFAQIQTGTKCGGKREIFQYLPVGVPMVSDRWWVAVQGDSAAVRLVNGGKAREYWSVARTDAAALRTPEAKEKAKDGAPIAFSEGAWYIVEIDENRTLVEFTVWTDPGGYIPAGLASSFAAGGVTTNIEALDKLVAAGPNCPY